jgi:small-conductance mechanosensitive channel
MEDKPDLVESTSPEEVEATLEPTAEVVAEETRQKPVVTFRGNSYDLTAVVAVTVAGVILLTCATCNFGFYCLPLVPIILGIIGLVSAKDSIDPERTKLLSWISVGTGAVIVVLVFLAVAAYIGFIIFAVAAQGGNF